MMHEPLNLDKARILVTNDDGIVAPGLSHLYKAAMALCPDVWRVAPMHEQSAQSHALTVSRPLRCLQTDDRSFAIDGTPTDCVVMGIHEILKDHKPDLVLSGVNHGLNAGEDVHYSGTVAAAVEATILGIRSIAFSLDTRGGREPNWEIVEHYLPQLIKMLAAMPWAKDVFYNVNFPGVETRDDIKAIEFVEQGKRISGFTILKRKDPRGRDYYWVKGYDSHQATKEDTDLGALQRHSISITPLLVNLTDHPMLKQLQQKFAPNAA